jgi:hypothetical protein
VSDNVVVSGISRRAGQPHTPLMFHRSILTLAATLATAAAVAGSAGAHPASSLPCRWHWNLTDGLPPGKVVAGMNVSCGSYQGGLLVLTARLYRWNPQQQRWQPVGASTRRWRNLNVRNWVEVTKPCAATLFRAEFRAVLRGPGGRAVGSVSVRSGRLRVSVPCVLTLGNPSPPGG